METHVQIFYIQFKKKLKRIVLKFMDIGYRAEDVSI